MPPLRVAPLHAREGQPIGELAEFARSQASWPEGHHRGTGSGRGPGEEGAIAEKQGQASESPRHRARVAVLASLCRLG